MAQKHIVAGLLPVPSKDEQGKSGKFCREAGVNRKTEPHSKESVNA